MKAIEHVIIALGLDSEFQQNLQLWNTLSGNLAHNIRDYILQQCSEDELLSWAEEFMQGRYGHGEKRSEIYYAVAAVQITLYEEVIDLINTRVEELDSESQSRVVSLDVMEQLVNNYPINKN